MEDNLSPAAKRILECFRENGLRARGTIHPANFGDAIAWEAGFVRDEEVRQALIELFSKGFLIEHAAAFELTEKGNGSSTTRGRWRIEWPRANRAGDGLIIARTCP